MCFNKKVYHQLIKVDPRLLPLAEMQEFVDTMGLDVSVWENPDRALTFVISIPGWHPCNTPGWEETFPWHVWDELFAPEEFVKTKLLAAWVHTVEGLEEGLLNQEDIQAMRCPQCLAWHGEGPHTCKKD